MVSILLESDARMSQEEKKEAVQLPSQRDLSPILACLYRTPRTNRVGRTVNSYNIIMFRSSYSLSKNCDVGDNTRVRCVDYLRACTSVIVFREAEPFLGTDGDSAVQEVPSFFLGNLMIRYRVHRSSQLDRTGR
jgi:hypothetical protein